MNKPVVKAILIVLAVASVIFYFKAPDEYSYPYCYGYFIVFCIEAFLIIKHRCKKTLVNFEFFFTVAFAFVNHVYPIVFYQIDPYFSLFAFSFPEDYINKGTAMATIAFSFLTLGFFRYNIPAVPQFTSNHGFGDNNKLQAYSNVLLLIMILTLVAMGRAGGKVGDWGVARLIRGIVDVFVFYTVFQRFYIYRDHNFSDVIKKNKLLLILVLGYILTATLVVGNRGTMIRLGSLVILLYSFLYHNIKKKYLIVLMIGAISFLFVIGAIRDSGSVSGAVEHSSSVLSVGRDLTINNRSLYVLMEYADVHGYNYGKTFLSYLLSPIPFAQSTFLKLSGWKEKDISSGSLVTADYFDNYASAGQDTIGLGTNLVGDVYIAFGLLGVIILFYYLGVTVSYLYKRSHLDSPVALLVYSILFITAIIWTRESYFKPLQMVIWCLAIYYLFDKRKIRIR